MNNFFALEGKVALITGGTSGIGLSTAKRFRAAGAKVVISGRREAKEIAEQIGAVAIKCDVSQEEDVKKLMQATFEEFNQLDILVNNAGVNKG